jgi:hypothetical protein
MRMLIIPIAALAIGCGLQMPDPKVDQVSPEWGWNGERTVVEIEGSNFFPEVVMDVGRGTETDLNRRFSAWLIGPGASERQHALSAVEGLDETRLVGVVESGLEPGSYGLLVEGPTGRQAGLLDAFIVSDIQADRLVLEPFQLVHTVQERASLRLFLLDRQDERVFVDLDVTVWATDADGNPIGNFIAASLEGQTDTPDGDGISGLLGEAGEALLGIEVYEPAVVTLHAVPTATDAAITPATVKVVWEPSDKLSVEIMLPDASFSATAGVPFDVVLTLHDEFGNVVDDRPEEVSLLNECSSFAWAGTVLGSTTVPVTINTATGTRCPEDLLYAATGVDGSSAGFPVSAAPLHHFNVEASPDDMRAGEVLVAQVTGADVFENRAVWPGDLEIASTLGGLTEIKCGYPSGAWCTMTPVAAGAHELVARWKDGTGSVVSGRSAPVTVRSALEVSALEVSTPTVVVAGEDAGIEVVAKDVYGNVIDHEDLDLSQFTFGGDRGARECDPAGMAPHGASQFLCTFYRARDSAFLEVGVDGVVAKSGVFAVINDELAAVEVVAAGASVVAGEPLGLNVAGFDSYANPYLVQTDPAIELVDDTGTLAPVDVLLDEEGTAVFDATFTQAGFTTVTALQGVRTLGSSGPVEVIAGDAVDLMVTVLEPWAWVGTPVSVRVEAVDAYDNRSDYDSEDAGIVIGSETGTEGPVALINGVGTLELEWDVVTLRDFLDATVDDLEGSSAVVRVFAECGDGPRVSTTFGGYGEAIACYDDGLVGGLVSGGFVDSAGGSMPVTLYGLALDHTVKSIGTEEPRELVLPETGIFELRVVVAQADGCAEERPVDAYVGEDDGSPVGPVVLSSRSDTLAVAGDSTPVDVGPVGTCTRDPAALARVFLRADIGRVEDAISTGFGLSIVLDGDGEGIFTYSTVGAPSGGTAMLSGWGGDETAEGATTVEVLGDEQPPVVWDQDPLGDTVGTFLGIEVLFSEPMLAESLTPERFQLTEGPDPVAMVDVSLSADGLRATALFDNPVVAEDGRWELTVNERVRDESGLFLDGVWGGAAGVPYVGVFGDVGIGVDPVTCLGTVPDAGVFRPDGDDGFAAEVDAIRVDFESGSWPTWWVITVVDPTTDTWLFRTWIEASGLVDSWAWDGRDHARRVVANGRYDIVVTAADGSGNHAEGCLVPVTVDNRRGG